MPRVPAWFWFSIWMHCVSTGASLALKNITAEVGQNVTLTCRVLNNNKPITAVKWIRPGQKPQYVLLYRDGRLDLKYQHPSYKNRADLQDRDMKDGDVSLNLTDLIKNDTGTYECRVVQRETNGSKSSTQDNKPISIIIHLEVHLPGGEAGGRKDGGDKDGGRKDGGRKDGGRKDGGDKGGGDKGGGHEGGGDKDGGNKAGGRKDGGDKGGGRKAGIIVGSVVGVILLLAVVVFLIYRLMKKKSHLPVPPDEAADEQML